jgi:hypothetical protein
MQFEGELSDISHPLIDLLTKHFLLHNNIALSIRIIYTLCRALFSNGANTSFCKYHKRWQCCCWIIIYLFISISNKENFFTRCSQSRVYSVSPVLSTYWHFEWNWKDECRAFFFRENCLQFRIFGVTMKEGACESDGEIP